MTILADPIEGRDPWRVLWRWLTSDALLIVLCMAVALGLLARFALPQTPAVGIADPVAYSRWEADAKLREGAFFEVLSGLGLNNVAQAAWWRIALVGLAAVAGLRLADRIARLGSVWRRDRSEGLRDEARLRVMLNAPGLDDLAHRLRLQRYRVVQPDESVLVADRAPLAEAMSLLLHLGLLLGVAGLLLNLMSGWDASDRTVAAGSQTTLHGGYAVTLADEDATSAQVGFVLQSGELGGAPIVLGTGENTRNWGGVNLALRQITPGYRVSASTLDGKPLFIRASNYTSPTTEVFITFSEDETERYIAIPDARLVLSFSALALPERSVRMQAFAIPSASVLTDTVVQPQLIVNETKLQFTPARSAVIDASYHPGDVLWWPGTIFAALGLVGVLVHPMHRIVIRHHGHWTEFYASGRGVRRVIVQLTQTQ